MARRDSGSPGRRPGPTSPSDDDRALWAQVAKTVKPLAQQVKERAALVPGMAPPEAPPAKPAPPAGKKKPAAARKPSGPSPLMEPPRKTSEAAELAHGTVAGVDRRQAVRLRRGKLPIDGRLDLHGDTQATAHRRLDAYLAEAQAAGKRCVLVVTGRGLGKAEGGVLKAQVPRWLNLPPNRDRVLAFDIAQPKHGGDGALYVLLKRDKKP